MRLGKHSLLPRLPAFLTRFWCRSQRKRLKTGFLSHRKKSESLHSITPYPDVPVPPWPLAADNPAINAPQNQQQAVTFLPFNDEKALEKELQQGDVCAVIFEGIQGVGGLDEPSENFVYALERLCNTYNSCLIADEVQAGFSRTGTLFSCRECSIQPHIVTMAKAHAAMDSPSAEF